MVNKCIFKRIEVPKPKKLQNHHYIETLALKMSCARVNKSDYLKAKLQLNPAKLTHLNVHLNALSPELQLTPK